MKEKRMNMMLVDDDVITTSMNEILIKKAFPDVGMHVFNHPVKALQMLQSRGTQIDLILLDYNMPEMDGLAFLEAMDNIPGQNPLVILLSSDDLRGIEHINNHPKVLDYWIKPLGINALRVFLEEFFPVH